MPDYRDPQALALLRVRRARIMSGILRGRAAFVNILEDPPALAIHNAFMESCVNRTPGGHALNAPMKQTDMADAELGQE